MKTALYLASLLALIFASLFVRFESLPLLPLPYVHYIFKPLTMLSIITITLLGMKSNPSFYSWGILTGLLFSLAGDICLMWPDNAFLAGLISFLFAHFCYIASFQWKNQLQVSLIFSLLLLGSSVGFFLWLKPFLGPMKIPVLFYTLSLSTMVWMAYHRWKALKNLSGLLAFIGSVLFMSSDMSLALQHFKGNYSGAVLLIFATYFTAQYLIALSTHAWTNAKKIEV